MAKFIAFERVGTIVEPTPTPENMHTFRVFYNLHSRVDLEDEPREGERSFFDFASKEDLRDHLNHLRDRQYETGKPVFGAGKFLGSVRGIFSLHELNRITRDDLRPLGNIQAVSFSHAKRKAQQKFPKIKDIVVHLS